jgi:hypothetical protein
MRALAITLVLGVAATAHAQPPAPYPPAPDPYPPPPPQPYPPAQPPPSYVPPPHQYVPVQLSVEDQKLLARGEIGDGEHIAGGMVSLLFGFGLGQAIQGRWSETGWMFTLGQTASIGAILVGASSCVSSSSRCEGSGTMLVVGGVIGIVVFRAWEIADAFAGPSKHNQRVRELRLRLGMPIPAYGKLVPYVVPGDRGGGVAGLTLRF